MRLIFIRHADPDYARDSLTPIGEEEAAALRDFLRGERFDAVYVSPLGRAKKTMEIALESHPDRGKAREKAWLREFDAEVLHLPQKRAWDFLPLDLETAGDAAYSLRDYASAFPPYARSKDFLAKRDEVFEGIDALLSEHGYCREDHHYATEAGNGKTLLFFCHFGVMALILSHLLNAPPLVFFQGLCAAPSSVTTLYTEERREGIASFRMTHFGETAHLKAKGMGDSFAARFSETFADPRRHD